ncbi:MAG: ATP synthase F1 subunit delta [Clostridia bacterium]|nr:ATP synthase F1 subunit delta [Clostridia bacterium]MBQ2434380.1 ATP synthase F1 subunit delta [Clostridia bacterium]MBQ5770070.1 ATP synthase F1 subunit delta [Clostridia bacterium]
MTRAANVYAEALYDLAKEEALGTIIFEEIKTLDKAFEGEKDFLRLLSTPNLSMDERISIIDKSFRGKIHAYTLNFLKILTEKGYILKFRECAQAYRDLYHQDNNILPVRVVTAQPLDDKQALRLKVKLGATTGKVIELIQQVDPACLGGIRLDYDGKRVEDTVAGRLEAVRKTLKNTVL